MPCLPSRATALTAIVTVNLHCHSVLWSWGENNGSTSDTGATTVMDGPPTSSNASSGSPDQSGSTTAEMLDSNAESDGTTLSASTDSTTLASLTTGTGAALTTGTGDSTETGDTPLNPCGNGSLEDDEECDDGDMNGKPEEHPYCSQNCRRIALIVFTTSETYTGKLGGISGANSKCQALADSIDVGKAKVSTLGTFRAWISKKSQSGVKSPSDFSHDNRPYYNLNHQLIAPSFGHLTTADPLSPLTVTNTFEDIPQNVGLVWTATKPNGEAQDLSLEDCTNWSSEDILKSAGYGTPDQNIGGIGLWTDSSIIPCNTLLHLYCFEQSDSE